MMVREDKNPRRETQVEQRQTYNCEDGLKILWNVCRKRIKKLVGVRHEPNG